MSDYSNPYSGSTGNEPTMPLAPASGYDQPSVPPIEPTVVDPFNSSTAGSSYPDFSYDTAPGHSAASRDSLGISPDPLPSSTNYTQPYAPTMDAYPEPDPEPLNPVVQQYQQYPSPSPPHRPRCTPHHSRTATRRRASTPRRFRRWCSVWWGSFSGFRLRRPSLGTSAPAAAETSPTNRDGGVRAGCSPPASCWASSALSSERCSSA